MIKKKPITAFERGQVKVLHEEGLSKRDIARKLHRSVHLKSSCLARGLDAEPGVSTGRKPKTSEADIRHVRRLASNSTVSSREIVSELNLGISARTVRRILHDTPHLQYEKIPRKPRLKAEDKVARLQLGRDHMQWVEQ